MHMSMTFRHSSMPKAKLSYWTDGSWKCRNRWRSTSRLNKASRSTVWTKPTWPASRNSIRKSSESWLCRGNTAWLCKTLVSMVVLRSGSSSTGSPSLSWWSKNSKVLSKFLLFWTAMPSATGLCSGGCASGSKRDSLMRSSFWCQTWMASNAQERELSSSPWISIAKAGYSMPSSWCSQTAADKTVR